MGVSHKHEDYEKWLPIWKRCRDAYEGQMAVHGAGVLYLSKLADETDAQYEDRKTRAGWYDATHKTIEAMTGMLFRKETQVTSKTNEHLFENIDLSGSSAQESIRSNADDALLVNRFGLMVDYPIVEEGGTVADEKAAGGRPIVSVYQAESIINWETEVIGGAEVLTLVVLVEDVFEKKDEFESVKSERFRVLDLHDGKYRQRVFIESKGKNSKLSVDTQIGKDFYPEMNHKKQTEIPFYFYPAVKIGRPPLLGLVDMNFAHYLNTADYEHGLHISMPTLFISGYTPKEGESIYVGSRKAQTLPESDAKAYYAEVKSEFKGQKAAMDDKKQSMAILGSTALKQQNKQTEAAETAAINKSGEVATLSALSLAMSNTYTKAFTKMLEWAGDKNPEVAVNINKDFFPMPISPQLITSMLAAVQAAEMSSEAFFYNLKQGELHPESVDYETEQERIGQSSPPRPDGAE